MGYNAGNDGRRPAHAPNQAKVLTSAEYAALEALVKKHLNAKRNLVAVHLSFKAGLRAHEIAGLEWKHVTTASGDISNMITITDDIAKGGGRKSRSGRIVPMSQALQQSLAALRKERPDDVAVFYPLCGAKGRKKNSAAAVHKFFERLYDDIGLVGASSHSGRRTFITELGQKANLVGCSVRDIQLWAGHAKLSTTQTYMEAAPLDRQRALIELTEGV